MKRGRFIACLAGGDTSLLLYNLLAGPPRAATLPSPQTHVFRGDERCVPPDHPESKYGRAREALLDRVAILAENIHRIRPSSGSVSWLADRGAAGLLPASPAGGSACTRM